MIVLNTQGTDWCVVMQDTLMWPAGQPELAEPVAVPGKGAPQGCRCFNDADVAILADGLPPDVAGPYKSCGDDPDPYECNEEYAGDTGAERTTDTGDSETGDDSPAVIVPGPTEVLR